MKKFVYESLDEFYDYQKQEQEEGEEQETEVMPRTKPTTKPTTKPKPMSPPSPLRKNRPNYLPNPKATLEQDVLDRILTNKKMMNKIKKIY
jgi:hypothetical protein